ncbi:MAG TPA: CHC2 zinc finger domain-containing protein [Thermomicrobiales bacterium]|jgi:hypothetical protein
MVAQPAHTNTWRWLSDEEIRHWRPIYRRLLALLPDDDTLDEQTRESTRQYLVFTLTECNAEIKRRRRAAELGVPIEGSRFTDGFKDDLKRRVNLDTMIETECGIALGRLNAQWERRGPCPFCGGSEHSTKFVVHTADDANQWFYCHTCRATGDAFALLMRLYGHPFPLAVEVLAAMCGVRLPEKPKVTPSDSGPSWAPDFVNMVPGR